MSIRSPHGRSFYALLTCRPVQIVGLASYSIYLWQNAFTRPGAVFDVSPVIGVCAAIAVGIAGYRSIELPVLRLRERYPVMAAAGRDEGAVGSGRSAAGE